MDQLLTVISSPWIILPLFLLAQIADIWTTNRALASGKGTEANKIIALLMDHFGSAWFAPKLLAMAGVAAFLVWVDVLLVLWVVTLVTLYIAIRNYRIGDT